MEFTTNLNVVIDGIEKDLKNFSGKGIDRLMGDITSSIHRNNRERIHSKGKAVNGSPIGGGRYSQDFMLTGAKNFKTPSMASAFFNKKQDWKTIKGQPLAVVSDGYKGFRRANKLKVDKVNLEFTGDLKRAFTFQKKTNTRWSLGFSNSKDDAKHDWLEDKYQQEIWGVGMEEQKDIDTLIDAYLKKL